MDDMLRRFLTKIRIKDLAPFDQGCFSSYRNDKENNKFYAELRFPEYLSLDVYENLFDTTTEFISKGGFGIHISFTYAKEGEQQIEKFLDEYIEKNGADGLSDYKVFADEEDKKIIFYYCSAAEAENVDDDTRKLKDFLDSISSKYHVLTQEKVYISDEEFMEEKERIYKTNAEKYSLKANEYERLNSEYQPCRLKDIEKYRRVLVEGKIFKLGEDRKTKKGMLIRSIEYTDGTDSIQSTFIESKRMPLEEIEKYKVGTKIRVKGEPYHDQYAHDELALRVNDIMVLPPDEERMDTYPRKRVELHLHTKMSAFDGVANISDYCKLASKWGHKAIAITDHGVCQAFPDAQDAGKKNGIKIIYGAELYVVNDEKKDVKFVYNPEDRSLGNCDFVVFDTETTGLSCRYDRLLEFGAVKVNMAGQVVDQIDFFINPDRKISGFAVEKSHITQEMVDRGKSIKDALRTIKEFFGNDILVAHNAVFDFDFLNEALKNNGMETIKNPVIDTLQLSRYLYPDMRSHREEALARKFDISFDSLSAHRANYDAEHLGQIFKGMLSDLIQQKPRLNLLDIADLPVTKEMLFTFRPFHITCYAKNADGLKDLYRIISESNTKYISSTGNPLVPKSYLMQYRKNLILGSACLNGEVFEKALTKSKESLVEAMKQFDFIEVQPPENYIYEIHRGQVSSMEDMKQILKDLIVAAKENGKTVCATGDCHYLNPEDKVFRDVMIAADGIKGVRHPLNLAPRKSAKENEKQAWYNHVLPNPDQHFRTTDEMMECFSFLNDKNLEEEIIIDNTNRISDLIDDGVRPTKTDLYPPSIPGAPELLTNLAYKTAKEMYGDPIPEVIEERMKKELSGIIDNGYAVIYWLSSEIVRWSNSEGYLIGSRGSVGSSFIATMTGITEVNPLPPHYRCPECHYLEWADVNEYESGFDLPAKKCPHCGHDLIGDGQNIPFATFLGFHAEKVPDIDLNFPSDFQSIAHEHMKEILNKTGNTCYKAGTIQTTQEKQARGYALGYFESLGKDTSKIRNAEIDHIASGCIDVKRSTGQHPGGVIVIPKGMEAFDFTPIQYPADDMNSTWMTTHYDFHKIHDNVLKFDMLGHVDPQAIRMQCDLCGFSFRDMQEKIPISDPEAHSLFWSADALKLHRNVLKQETGALGLPEFGTENGRRVLLETQPRSFADLVRISGLSHGTDVFAGNAEVLISEKGFKLKDVIACRDDIMTVLHDKYGVDNSDAFQIMEFTRKGNFAKPGSEDKKQKYITIMKEHQVPDWYIESCMKIKYMFPKGHAVAYVTNCIRCAWFKVHEPLSYYATYFSLRCDGYDIQTMMKGIDACLRKRNDILTRQANHEPVSNPELATINALESTIEMYDRGYSFAPLSVLTSEATGFTVDYKQKKVIPSLTSINGLGESVALQIVNARKERQFTSVDDLIKRAKIGNTMVEKIREVGGLDGLSESNQLSLFDMMG